MGCVVLLVAVLAFGLLYALFGLAVACGTFLAVILLPVAFFGIHDALLKRRRRRRRSRG